LCYLFLCKIVIFPGSRFFFSPLFICLLFSSLSSVTSHSAEIFGYEPAGRHWIHYLRQWLVQTKGYGNEHSCMRWTGFKILPGQWTNILYCCFVSHSRLSSGSYEAINIISIIKLSTCWEGQVEFCCHISAHECH
jgi:hypothetical protein